MSVSYQSMVANVGLCDFGQERSWILRKRMECEAINDYAKDITDGIDEEEGSDKQRKGDWIISYGQHDALNDEEIGVWLGREVDFRIEGEQRMASCHTLILCEPTSPQRGFLTVIFKLPNGIHSKRWLTRQESHLRAKAERRGEVIRC